MKRFERSNGLDTALYKNYLYLFVFTCHCLTFITRHDLLPCCRPNEVRKNCRRDKIHWIESKCAEAQDAANINDTNSMYMIVRELTNSMSISSIPIKSKDGVTLMTEEEQYNRWMEHFEGVLNQPDHTNLIDFEQDTPTTLFDFTMGNISIEKVAKSIHALKKQ